jgi:hypothetical protein
LVSALLASARLIAGVRASLAPGAPFMSVSSRASAAWRFSMAAATSTLAPEAAFSRAMALSSRAWRSAT